MVGYEFVVQKNFPFATQGERGENEVEVVDIKAGEQARIISFDPIRMKYKLLNISLGNKHAWVEVDEDSLLKLQRKGSYK